MTQSQAIGIRLEDDFMHKIDTISVVEKWDRSTTIRVLLEQGYWQYIKKKAAEAYKEGKTTMSRAANDANISIWEMQQYLVRHGYKSSYSVEDLENEMALLKRLRKLK